VDEKESCGGCRRLGPRPWLRELPAYLQRTWIPVVSGRPGPSVETEAALWPDCSVPQCDADALCDCSVPQCDADALRDCSVPQCDADALRDCSVPQCDADALCDCSVPQCDADALWATLLPTPIQSPRSIPVAASVRPQRATSAPLIQSTCECSRLAPPFLTLAAPPAYAPLAQLPTPSSGAAPVAGAQRSFRRGTAPPELIG
jgi:hypothetical protein